jgi:hypothetical protein
MTVRAWRVLAAVTAGALGWFIPEHPSNMGLFSTAGRSVLAGHLSALYSVRDDQAGPVQVVLALLLTLGGDPAVPSRWTRALVDVLIMLTVVRLAERATRRGHAQVSWRQIGVAAFAALWLITPAFWGGHPIEVLVPVAWVAAAHLARERPVRAALLLALATGVAPWAVLGYPCLLRRGRLASWMRTVALAGTLSAALYLPFLIAGHGRSLGYQWRVSHDSLLHAVLPSLTLVDWNLRLAQAAVVVAGCAFVALARPETSLAAPTAAMTAALLRLLTDPLAFDYYWVPVGTTAIAVLLVVPDFRSRVGALALMTGYLAWACHPLGLGPAGGLCLLGLVILLGVSAASTMENEHHPAGATPMPKPVPA